VRIGVITHETPVPKLLLGGIDDGLNIVRLHQIETQRNTIRIKPVKIKVLISTFLVIKWTVNSFMTIKDVNNSAGRISMVFLWGERVSKAYVEKIPKARLIFKKSRIMLRTL